MTIPKIKRIVLAAVAVTCSLCAVRVLADSQVRIVRLSDVEGGVEISRTARGFEKAFLNLPITQENQVRTQSDGRAQVEFEDGSAIRLAPYTTVRFTQLSLTESGTRVSAVSLFDGMAYVDLKGGKDGQLTLTVGHETMVLSRPVHMRIETSNGNAAVAVFSGSAEVRTASATVEISKNRTAFFDAQGNESGKLAKSIDPTPYDAWDKQQDRYQERFGNNLPVTASAYSYGYSDLNYYGSYFNAPGYGMMWQPYLVGSNWDPFMDGAWAFYPGTGYGWVSAYPWGWAPYHSGSWAFIPGRGWAWQPGGSWTPLVNSPRVGNAPAGFVAPKPPSAAGQSLVVVNRGPATTFAGRSTSKIVLRTNSAGLGVPRGGVNNLAQASQQAATRGTVTARIHEAPVRMPSAWGEPQNGTYPPNTASRSSFPTRSAGAPVRSAGPAVHSGGGRGSKN